MCFDFTGPWLCCDHSAAPLLPHLCLYFWLSKLTHACPYIFYPAYITPFSNLLSRSKSHFWTRQVLLSLWHYYLNNKQLSFGKCRHHSCLTISNYETWRAVGHLSSLSSKLWKNLSFFRCLKGIVDVVVIICTWSVEQTHNDSAWSLAHCALRSNSCLCTRLPVCVAVVDQNGVH